MRHPSRTLSTLPALLALAFAAILAGCGGGGGSDDGSPSLEEGWAAVQQAHDALVSAREELAAMEPGDEATARRNEIRAEEDAFYNDLVSFINASGMVEGEPLNEIQTAAVRMKSAEDMRIAQRFIDERADYGRAIDIYNGSLALDPDNEELQAALEHAETMRYMTRERFEQARLSMTEDEVRAAIGPVKPNNVKDYDQDTGKVVAWFYPREDGGTAAVWFRDDRGTFRVYDVKWDQVPPKS